MATLNRIPFFDAPFQEMRIVLNGISCSLAFNYNKMIDRWSFDLGMDTTPVIISGRRIVLGADLLDVYSIGIGRLYAIDFFQLGVDPGYDELVDGRVRLYHVTEAEVETILSGM